MLRAKFFVVSKTEYANQHSREQTVRIELQPVYGDTEENKKFWSYTPSGKIELNVKPEVASFYEIGKQYYVDFTPAPVETAG